MIEGFFINNTPYIRLTLAKEFAVKNEWFILDTGFSGELCISSQIAQGLGVHASFVVPMTMANGQILNFPATTISVSIEGYKKETQAIISRGECLAGIGFLAKFEYQAVFNGKYKTLQLHQT